MTASGSKLLAHLTGSGERELAELLAEDVAFHSPVADYRGRAAVAHLLAAIGAVLEDLTEDRVVKGEDGVTTFVSARVGGEHLDGVLDERLDEDGLVAEATLLLRPFAALRVAIGEMARLLAADPLPGDPPPQ